MKSEQKAYFLVSNNLAKAQLVSPDWHKVNQQTKAQFTIPFWAFFHLLEDTDTLHFSFTYHVPVYKLAQRTSRQQVHETLNQMCLDLKHKVRLLTLLHKVSTDMKLMPEIVLSPNQIPTLTNEHMKSFAQSEHTDHSGGAHSTAQMSVVEHSPPQRKPTNLQVKTQSKMSKLLQRQKKQTSVTAVEDLNQSTSNLLNQSSVSRSGIQDTSVTVEKDLELVAT